MKTFNLRKEDVKRDWWVVDAEGKTLGRICTEIARKLMGKHKPVFTPHIDSGDFVIVVNCEKINLTGSKEKNKSYFKHTGYIGSHSEATVEEIRRKFPERILQNGVSGMLPKNKMRKRRMKRLKLYTGASHPHSAQQPKELSL